MHRYAYIGLTPDQIRRRKLPLTEYEKKGAANAPTETLVEYLRGFQGGNAPQRYIPAKEHLYTAVKALHGAKKDFSISDKHLIYKEGNSGTLPGYLKPENLVFTSRKDMRAGSGAFIRASKELLTASKLTSVGGVEYNTLYDIFFFLYPEEALKLAVLQVLSDGFSEEWLYNRPEGAAFRDFQRVFYSFKQRYPAVSKALRGSPLDAASLNVKMLKVFLVIEPVNRAPEGFEYFKNSFFYKVPTSA